ncbi:MAG TPA: DHH family phosphoesterase, partial [Candidatus Lokiarchaeia archaeon]|nr:DHH family phosphoesterase [Candidatus Lokiarchaeia archaeon]
VIAKEGACLYGAMHEKVKNALAWSILPYVPEAQSNPAIAETILDSVNVPATKIVESLEPDEVERLANAISVPITGTYAILPKKQGILRYAFEHALLLNVIGFKDKDMGLQALAASKATAVMKQSVQEHVTNLSKNLTTFCTLPRIESQNAIFVDVEGILPPSAWSDTASFASVNNIFDPNKMLFLSGIEEERIKFSVRCSPEFIASHGGEDVSTVIAHIRGNFDAAGGGHNLAGGLRISPSDFGRIKETIENYF